VTDLAFELISDNESARRAVAGLLGLSPIGIDTETFWTGKEGQSKVSLIQIAARDVPVLVVDALSVDVNILRPIVDEPSVQMAAHNAKFDDGMLRSAGLNPSNLVDTLRMSRLALHLPSYSLAFVCANLFGVELDKSFQKSNWRRRPLSQAQLYYAALDASITLRLFMTLTEMLREKGQLQLAMRAAAIGPAKPRSQRVKSSPLPLRELTEPEKHALLALKKWRLERSFRLRIPAYMVCPDRTLEHLVIEKPQRFEDLEAIHGLGPSRVADFGRQLIEIIIKHFGESAEIAEPHAPAGDSN
jgi:ribonuclease D